MPPPRKLTRVGIHRLFEQPQANFRQRLREFYWPARQKPGAGRLELDAEACFAPLLRWILLLCRRAGRPPDELVLALDVTLIRDRLAIISLSVVLRGSALPVAWKILPVGEEGAWIPCCVRLLQQLRAAVEGDRSVVVVCDRGLQSPRLFRAISGEGFHPMMRLTRQGTWRPKGQSTWYRLADLLPGPGRYYLGRGELLKTKPLPCTLVALWEEGYEAPWLLMTDLAPSACRGAFYGLRAWIEQGFRGMKSGAYRCERLRVSEPARAERIFLVLSASLVWTHAVGSRAQRIEEPCALSAVLVAGVRRVLGVHRVGWIELLVAALRGEALPLPEVLFVWPRPEAPPAEVVHLDEPP